MRAFTPRNHLIVLRRLIRSALLLATARSVDEPHLAKLGFDQARV
jgi:hypothetical protein